MQGDLREKINFNLGDLKEGLGPDPNNRNGAFKFSLCAAVLKFQSYKMPRATEVNLQHFSGHYAIFMCYFVRQIKYGLSFLNTVFACHI